MPSSFSRHAIAARPIEVTSQLSDPHLPDANCADTFKTETHRDFGDMRLVAGQTISSISSWARGLLRARNTDVAPFGPKADGTKDRVVLGFDDRHLEFRIIIDRNKEARTFRLRATMRVDRHNALGRIYIAIITPFHRMIVRSVLINAV